MPSSVICVDASLVVRLLATPSYSLAIVRRWRDWHELGSELVAPTLLYYEVGNALHRYVRAGLMLPSEGKRALELGLNLGITLFGDAALHLRAMALARELALPAAYDAHYLALAERLDGELWTADERLLKAVAGKAPWVHLVTEGGE